MNAVILAPGLCGLFQESQAGHGEFACGARSFDQAAPPLMTAVAVGGLTPAGKRAILCPVARAHCHTCR